MLVMGTIPRYLKRQVSLQNAFKALDDEGERDELPFRHLTGDPGPLPMGDALTLTFKRRTDGFFIRRDYRMNAKELDEAFDIFMHLGALRQELKLKDDEPGLVRVASFSHSPNGATRGRYGQRDHILSMHHHLPGFYAHKDPNGSDNPTQRRRELEARSLRRRASTAFYKPECRDPLDSISRQDVWRLVTLLCDPVVVEDQVDSFMQRFDLEGSGSITRQQFRSIAEMECGKERLNWCETIFFTFDEPSSSVLSQYLAIFILTLILISSIAFVAATSPDSRKPNPNDDEGPPVPKSGFDTVEAFCILIFTVEYLCRVLFVWGTRDANRQSVIQTKLIDPVSHAPTLLDLKRAESVNDRNSYDRLPPAVEDEDSEDDDFNHVERGPIKKTYDYMTSPLNIIDAVAIIPWYIELISNSEGGGLAVLRILRLARVFRIFRSGALRKGFLLLANVFSQSMPALKLLAFFALIGAILFGSMMFIAERGFWREDEKAWVRPDLYGTDMEVTPFRSIPRAMWFIIVTSTTVGYGDLYPTTNIGKAIGTFTVLAGILILALPITIIGSNFASEYDKMQREELLARRRGEHQELLNEVDERAEEGEMLADENEANERIRALSSTKIGGIAEENTARLSDAGDVEMTAVRRVHSFELPEFDGPMIDALNRHCSMLHCANQVLTRLQKLHQHKLISGAAVANVIQEMYNLMQKRVKKRLSGSELDASTLVVLHWLHKAFDVRKQQKRGQAESSSPNTTVSEGGGPNWQPIGRASQPTTTQSNSNDAQRSASYSPDRPENRKLPRKPSAAGRDTDHTEVEEVSEITTPMLSTSAATEPPTTVPDAELSEDVIVNLENGLRLAFLTFVIAVMPSFEDD